MHHRPRLTILLTVLVVVLAAAIPASAATGPGLRPLAPSVTRVPGGPAPFGTLTAVHASSAARFARPGPAAGSPPPTGVTPTTQAIAWGDDLNGQLGDGGSSASVPTPRGIPLPAGTALTQVAGGDDHSVALAPDGSVWGWGDDSQGELGDNSNTSSDSAPVHVSLPDGAKAAQVAAGGMFSLALTSTGQVYAWGENYAGQLGDDSTNPSYVPTLVDVPSGVTVKAVSAGEDYALALTTGGQVYAWGDDTFGQLGDGQSGSGTMSDVPVQVGLPANTAVSEVSTRGYFSLALTDSGSVLSWGAGFGGTLGDGGTSSASTPGPVSLPPNTTVINISAGDTFALALTSGGQVYAWGAGSKGQIGNGSDSESDTPTPVSLPANVAVDDIEAGGSYGLALASDGQVLAWGDNTEGQLGTGTAGGTSDTPAPVVLPPNSSGASIAAGEFHALAILAPTVLSVQSSFGPSYGGTPVTITGTGLANVTEVKFGSAAAPAFTVKSAGVITATTPASTGTVNVTLQAPVVDSPIDSSFTVAADRYTYVASGTTVDWGQGISGTLGNGTTANAATPVVPTLAATVKVTQLSSETSLSLALTSTGQVYQWGAGVTTPTLVHFPSGTTVTRIAAESDAALALTSSGRVYAWGANANAELGDGNTNPVKTPVQVALPAGVVVTAIAGEGYGGLALASSGQVYGWGLNSHGGVGDGTTTERPTPVPVSVPAGITVTRVAAEFYTGLALASNGQVLAWGDNADGELGSDSTAPESLAPVAVSLPAGDGVTAIAGEAFDGLALTSAGKVLAWGLGADGELGDHSPNSSNTPVSVDLPSTVTVAAIGSEAGDGLAITSVGAVSAWGQNADGQLGDGSSDNSETPRSLSLPSGVTASAIGQGFGYTGLAVVGTPPVVSSLSPALAGANGGATVNIAGAGFAGATAVSFGGKPAAGFTVRSSTQISAVAPAGTGTVNVTVAGPAGTSPVSVAARFTYLANGTPIGWGANNIGELGNGSSETFSDVPAVPSLPAGTKVTATASGSNDYYWLTSAGAVYAAGYNADGELGDNGAVPYSYQPVRVELPAGVRVTAIAGESMGVLALTSTGQVYGWGYNNEGELGNGTTGLSQLTPVQVKLPAGVSATAIAGGVVDGYALGSNGTVYSYGYNQDGELGTGTSGSQDVATPTPVVLPSGVKVTAISAVGYQVLALTSSGAVYDWGYNGFGELGDGSEQSNPTPTAIKFPAGTTITAVAGQFYASLALTSTGKVYAWGDNSYDELGDGGTSNADRPMSVRLPAGAAVKSIGSGGFNGFAITSNGELLSWGQNSEGGLGNGRTSTSSPVAVAVSLPPGAVATAIATGPGFGGLAVLANPPA